MPFFTINRFMSKLQRHCCVLGYAVLILLPCAAAWARQATPVSASITVSHLRHPVDKSYRRMVDAMNVFKNMSALAPGATLRFKLLPRLADTRMDGIEVKIVGDTLSIPVPVAADNTFALEIIEQALREDASVLTNRKVDSMTWRVEIRSPGVPPNMRRLGDLRLECFVGRAARLVSQGPTTKEEKGANRFGMRRNPCSTALVGHRYFIFADRPLFNVTLIHGNRRESLAVEYLYSDAVVQVLTEEFLRNQDSQVLVDRAYFAPLRDPSWPDDTLIEYEFMDEGSTDVGAEVHHPQRTEQVTASAPKPSTAEAAKAVVNVGKSTKADIAAALGNATSVVDFASAYSVWVYKFPPSGIGPSSQLSTLGQIGAAIAGQKDEVVILFAPSGVAAKARLRSAPVKSAASSESS